MLTTVVYHKLKDGVLASCVDIRQSKLSVFDKKLLHLGTVFYLQQSTHSPHESKNEKST